MTSIFVTALAIALIIEGLAPALFPNKWRAYVLKLAQEPVSAIRSIGITLVIVGCVLLWINS